MLLRFISDSIALCRVSQGVAVPKNQAEGDRLMAEAVKLGFDADAAEKADADARSSDQ